MKPWKVEESKASCHAHLNNKRHKKKTQLGISQHCFQSAFHVRGWGSTKVWKITCVCHASASLDVFLLGNLLDPTAERLHIL